MVDTFSGIGGFSLAAEWTGRIRPVQFIEIDPWCRRVLAKHWPGVPIHDDIKTFLANAGCERQPAGRLRGGAAAAREILNLGSADGGYSRLDLITGGFPCQPFSQAGKQRGAHDDRYLWPELARVVAALRPRWCLFENVFGIVNMAGGLERVWADLEADGYEVGAVVIPAAAVGAPHKRDRVWIVAHTNEDQRRPVDDALRGRYGDADQSVQPGRDGALSSGGSDDAAYPDGEGEPTGSIDGGAGHRQLRPRDDWHPHIIHEAPLSRTQQGADAQPEGDCECVATADTNSSGFRAWRGDAQGRQPDADWGCVAPRGEAEALGCLGVQAHGLPGLVDGRFTPRPFGPDWEDGIPRVTTHEEDRVSKLKALGNSIVPQVAYELMLMMLAVDDEAN